jgi:hypothetical protein
MQKGCSQLNIFVLLVVGGVLVVVVVIVLVVVVVIIVVVVVVVVIVVGVEVGVEEMLHSSKVGWGGPTDASQSLFPESNN